MQQIPSWRAQRLLEAVDVEQLPQHESAEWHLRDYWKMVRKRRRLVVLVFLAVFGVGAYLTLSQTPLYTASATLKIEPQDPGVIQIQEILATQNGGMVDYDYYETQFALLKSRPLAARVITDLDLASNRAFTKRMPRNVFVRLQSWLLGSIQAGYAFLHDLFASPPVEEDEEGTAAGGGVGQEEEKNAVDPGLIGRYLSFLNVQPVKGTRLVQIVFTTPDPRLSQQLANAHAETFIATTLETRFALTKEAREFLEKKLAELGGKIQRGEEALQRFRQTHGIVSLEGNENLVVERLVDLNKRLTDARARRIELESLYRMVANRNTRNLSEVIENTTIQQLKTTLLNLEAEYARLGAAFTPAHPRLVELSEQIREARRRMEREIDNVVRKIESDYGAAQAREEALQAEAERQQKAALDLKEIGAQYAVLQADVDSNRSLYESVLKRLNETTVSNEVPVSNITLVERAEKPDVPSSPQTQRNLLLAAACGLFLGVGLALFREYMDASVSTPEEVWQSIAVPTLGVVPHLKSLGRRTYGNGTLQAGRSAALLPRHSTTAVPAFVQQLLVSHHPFSAVSESYNTICSALLYAQGENPPRVVMFTSAHPGDGKTITTLNVAIALVQCGHSAVVVDADLRKGKCHTLLRLENQRGLSSILTEKFTVEEGLQRTAIPGLSLLPRGESRPHPMALFSAPKMAEVMEALRQRFDFVLVDSPPAIVVSDAAALAQYCDGVVLVLRAQTTSVETAQRLVARMQAVHAPILGVVLNGVDIRDPDYADYHYYYSSYYAAVQKEADDQH